MRIRIFQYPLPAPPELDDLNVFLASQRVATVTHYVVSGPSGSMLVFIVECAGNSPSRPATSGSPKVDYREELTPDEFARYSALRDARKAWAESDGVPVYTVFTNAQLAAMARGPVETSADLERIEGIGAPRIEKYGARLLALLAAAPTKPEAQ